MTARPFVLATRGSPLALWQAEAVRTALLAGGAAPDVRLHEVKTAGDRVLDRPIAELGGQGAFTVEVDRAVRDGAADAAVHSLKDLTTTCAEGLVIGAILRRGPPEDVLISPKHRTLDLLPRDAVVATGSLRRRAMLLRERPDLRFVDVRGNIATRLDKLDAGECRGMVLARAGLERLGCGGRATEVFSVDRLLPAVGQALVGVTCRADDARALELLGAISHPEGFACGTAERALLRALRGGCQAPVGGHATVVAGRLTLKCRVLSKDGRHEVAGEIAGPVAEAERLGVALAERLVADGADRLLAEVRG